MIDLRTSPKKICALIVTYADRGRYLEKLVKSLFAENVARILIIDNHSVPSSSAEMDRIAAADPQRVSILHLDKNYGTAIAFKLGMQSAEKYPDIDFLWILDDDNTPIPGALKELTHTWDDVDCEQKETMLMLASYRNSKPVYKRAVLTNRPDIIIGEKNYFRAFHLVKLSSMFFRKKSVKETAQTQAVLYGDISAAPYGGMFFHKKIFSSIGYPNEKFYIYSDDHEYSHRLIVKGGRIILVLNSIIADVECSWNAKGLGIFNICRHFNKTLLYYSIRNRVYLELKITVNNYITYFVNACIYSLSVLFFSALTLNFANFLAFWRGLTDGLKGRMGINKKYTLE